MERLARYCIWHATPQHAVMCGFVESATPGTTAASWVRRNGSSLSPSFCPSIFCHHTTYLILHQAMRIVTICATLHERYIPRLLCCVSFRWGRPSFFICTLRLSISRITWLRENGVGARENTIMAHGTDALCMVHMGSKHIGQRSYPSLLCCCLLVSL